MRIALTTGLVLLSLSVVQSQHISEWHAFRSGGGGAFVKTIKRFGDKTAIWFGTNSDSVMIDSIAFLHLTPIPPSFYSFSQSSQAYFVVLDSAQKPLIQLQFSAGKSIHTHSMEMTEQGDYLLTYMIYDDTVYLNNNIFIADTTIKKGALCLTKVSANGEIAFTRYFPCESVLAAHIALMPNGAIALAGYVNLSDITFDNYTLHCLGCHVEDTDIFVALLSSNGQTIKAKRFGSILYDYCHDLISAPNGDLYLTGATLGDFYCDSIFLDNHLTWLSGDAYLLKLDADLNALWAIQAGSADDESGSVLSQDSEGNIYWGCQFWGDKVIVEGDTLVGDYSNSFVAKVSNEGQVIWKKVFASEGPLQTVNTITTDADNNVWVALRYFVSLMFDDVSLPGGAASPSGIRSDATLIQMDSDGGILQYHVANSRVSESFQGTQPLANNQLFVSGSANFDDGDSLQFFNMTLHDWPNFDDPDFYFILDLPTVATETPPGRQGGIFVMPNPVCKSDLFQVRMEEEMGSRLVSLYDNLGRLIWSRQVNTLGKQFSLPAPSRAGIYYLCIQTNNQRFARKVIVTE